MRAVAKGFDSNLGIMPVDRGISPGVVDPMEPPRPQVDRIIPEYVKSATFHPADFAIRNDGAVG
jgi:hypothetical protein